MNFGFKSKPQLTSNKSLSFILKKNFCCILKLKLFLNHVDLCFDAWFIRDFVVRRKQNNYRNQKLFGFDFFCGLKHLVVSPFRMHNYRIIHNKIIQIIRGASRRRVRGSARRARAIKKRKRSFFTHSRNVSQLWFGKDSILFSFFALIFGIFPFSHLKRTHSFTLFLISV